MSRKLSYRGKLAIGGPQDRIKLSTMNGKTGYQINKLRIIPTRPGVGDNVEILVKVYRTNQTGTIAADVDFTESDLLGCAYYKAATAADDPTDQDIIFDNEKFNQDIYIYAVDQGGATIPVNYYIELNTMSLSDIESTMLTLKSIKDVVSNV